MDSNQPIPVVQTEKIVYIDLDSEAFNYAGTFDVKSVVDWDKLQYGNVYKSPEFFESKFPPGFEYLPGFESIFENMADNAKTPLQEIEERIFSSQLYNESTQRNDTNFSEFKNCN